MGGSAMAAYRLVRSARKTVALQVSDHDVVVRAPHRMPVGQIEAFVQSNQAWLARHLARRQERLAASQLELTDGVILPVLGQSVVIQLDTGCRRARWRADNTGREVLALPACDPVGGLEKALRARVLAWFEGRVSEHCQVLGLAPPVVRLGAARTRWGSCSRRSGIRLHWKLALLAPEVADYVVAHEVAHLREMNHSDRFWSVVASLCPDWPDLRARLRREGQCLPIFMPPTGGLS